MKLIESLETEFGSIRIMREEKTGITTYYQNKCFHSQSTAEGISTCAYIHVMYAAIMAANAKRVLLIGCAGGSLATMLHRAGCSVTVVDINPYSFGIAKDYFGLPEEVECVLADGAEYIAKTKRLFDAIAIDAFDAEAGIPEVFTTHEFFESVKNSLAPNAVMAMNVMIMHDFDVQADRFGLHMEMLGMPAALYDWPGMPNRNTIMVAGNIKKISLPNGKEPTRAKKNLNGLVKRKAKKHALDWVG